MATTEVILMDDVANLGAQGDVVKVHDGYARNFLFPKKLAAPVTEATRRRLVKLRKEREVSRQAETATAQLTVAALSRAKVVIRQKTSDGTHLYGSVTEADIAAVLVAQGVAISKDAIRLDHPLKELGSFDVKVRLHPDVEASVKVAVVEA